ncbi:hypothetical protein P9D51_05930 [Bacillus sonorensis]|uniref:hypothetical protein n=1 Tax=Bacillus sonorensis TaxID=119858 RepID=UPI0004957F47|nr:hypothetical protein [Bacillus sonorensis]MCY8024553.1 hypothetical protein [Bacillus sonorensis]MCZ0067943.1 hypothetical protein [Bacillus sonorensis]MCZ0098359.1 hypothetical protein [Bacillus sonorensis]MEC1355929.1 hypothetical protein [Bacillus sonorensis]MEC1425666.1 hypothetical protein [Bacillus sonorensis]
MDWLEFISHVIHSLIWPVTLVIIVLLLKEPVSERLKELMKLKYKDFELEFGMRVQALAAARIKGKAGQAAIKSRSPSTAVIDSAWSEVEEALHQAAKRYDADSGHHDLLRVIDVLHEQGAVSKETVSLVRELWNLRFIVQGEVSSKSALEYRSLCQEAAEKLRSVGEVPSTF